MLPNNSEWAYRRISRSCRLSSVLHSAQCIALTLPVKYRVLSVHYCTLADHSITDTLASAEVLFEGMIKALAEIE